MQDVALLVHGAFHGPWCWTRTIDALASLGVAAFAVDLDRGGLEADRQSLQSTVAELRAEGARVHAVGHSLGCCSIAALEPRSLASAVLVAGPIAPGPGRPLPSEMLTKGFRENLEPRDDGRLLLSGEPARDAFYHRCRSADADWALAQLRPTFVYGAPQSVPPLWESLPVTYVACRQDRAIHYAYQAAAARALPASAELDSDHSPMLSQPERLAGLIHDFILAVAA